MKHHVIHPGTYFLVFFTLLILTGVTTVVGFYDLGRWNTVVALAIAVCKATLVVLFFMHLRYSSALPRLVMLGGLFWLALLIGLTLVDNLTRVWDSNPRGWETTSSSVQRP
ncbi:MAG: cytochrome C oxidase subunit IV family protein [Acidobacteriia bacterium]|nr:cytochrome C oxidase subunit IV family protein [Terriglobia bacterium]